MILSIKPYMMPVSIKSSFGQINDNSSNLQWFYLLSVCETIAHRDSNSRRSEELFEWALYYSHEIYFFMSFFAKLPQDPQEQFPFPISFFCLSRQKITGRWMKYWKVCFRPTLNISWPNSQSYMHFLPLLSRNKLRAWLQFDQFPVLAQYYRCLLRSWARLLESSKCYKVCRLCVLQRYLRWGIQRKPHKWSQEGHQCRYWGIFDWSVKVVRAEMEEWDFIFCDGWGRQSGSVSGFMVNRIYQFC